MRVKPFEPQRGRYTIVDNVLIDHIMPRLSANGWRVLTYIIRMTRGWQRDSAQLSYSDIQRGTGIAGRQHLQRALYELSTPDLPLIRIDYAATKRTRKPGPAAQIISLNLDLSLEIGNETLPVISNETLPVIGNETLPVIGNETLPVIGNEKLPSSIDKKSSKKNQVNKAVNSSNATATATADMDEDVLAELLAAGINGKMRMLLASEDYMTVEYVRGHAEQAKRDGISTGLLITRLRDGDPLPADISRSNVCPDCGRGAGYYDPKTDNCHACNGLFKGINEPLEGYPGFECDNGHTFIGRYCPFCE